MNADGSTRADGLGPVPRQSGSSDPAPARGRGPAEAVASRWRQLVLVWRWERERQEKQAPGTPYPGIVALLEAAASEPALRVLYPFTSHFTVSFSSTVRFPYVVRAPSVTPLADGTFQVHRREVPGLLGCVATAREAVALVRDNLPEGLGAAVADAKTLDA